MAALVGSVALATGGSVLAASPTQASVNDYQQCANDKAGSTTPTQDPTDCVPQGWINGILNAQNSQYSEDQVTPQRLDLVVPSGSPTTGRTITIRYLARKGQGGVGNHAYDYLATWNFTQTNADQCQGIPAAECVGGTASTFPIPSDPTVVADSNGAGSSTALHELPQANRMMTMYGGTITAISTPVHDNAAGSGDDFATITITYSVASTASDTDVMLLFGGHLAASTGPRGWGAGVGSSFISGGPYHIKIDAVDGASVGERDNQIVSVLGTPATALTTNAGGPYTLGANGTVALSDVAHLTGGTSNAGGTITFMLFSDAACSVQVDGNVSTPVNGADGKDYPSPPITVNAPGTYYWVASYSGDAGNLGSSTTCGDPNETPLVIKPPPIAPPAVTHPAITIVKNPKSQTVTRGGTATFTITVTNNGDVALTNVTVSDALSPNCNKTIGTLAPGQSTSYTCTRANVTASFTNVAVATGTGGGKTVTAQDTAPVTAKAAPLKPKKVTKVTPKVVSHKKPKATG